MAPDRDLAVAFARARFSSEGGRATGWEMMSATGVRGLRLLAETGAFRSFTFSEANPEACRVLRENASRFPEASVVEGDCRVVPPGAPFDLVDLDPYGTPTPFVRTALESVRLGGVAAVTATDMMVLAGAQPKACVARYRARPVRGRLGPEGGLRVLLAYLAHEAEKIGRSICPLLAYARDHYVRAYVEVGAKSGASIPVETVDPARWEGPRLSGRGPFGPLWLGPLFDRETVDRLSVPDGAARPREVGQFIARLKEEARVDRPFYYEANVLSSDLGLPAPPSLRAIEEGLRAAGFPLARTHARPEGFRTDAPRTVVEELFRRLGGVPQSQKTRVRAYARSARKTSMKNASSSR